ncbi:MAG TPA: hypothetical protein PLT02_10850, partial [Chitinophagaceae bacterium]|nr:hypothetical protein [Chitinophagaceae bacterium]
AKNLKLEDALGISTCFANQRGLPLSFVSAIANSSRFSSISSAMRLRILNRCSTGETLQAGKAFLADSTAIFISFSLLSGI